MAHLGSQLGPKLINLTLLAIDSVSSLRVGLHQAVGSLVQLSDLVSQGSKVTLQPCKIKLLEFLYKSLMQYFKETNKGKLVTI